jgi:hypothetical protein
MVRPAGVRNRLGVGERLPKNPVSVGRASGAVDQGSKLAPASPWSSLAILPNCTAVVGPYPHLPTVQPRFPT